MVKLGKFGGHFGQGKASIKQGDKELLFLEKEGFCFWRKFEFVAKKGNYDYISFGISFLLNLRGISAFPFI